MKTLMEEVFQNIKAPVALTDVETSEIMYINSSFTETLGYSQEDITGKTFLEITHNEDISENLQKVKEISKIGSGTIVKRYIKKDGTLLWSRVLLSKIDYKNKKLWIAFITDITEEIILRDKLYKKELYDDLTLIHNRKYFIEKIQYLINRNNKFAVHIFNIDDFKCINEKFGHDYGDYILKVFAKKIKNSVRENDLVARVAGDEFGIIQLNYKNDKEVEDFTKRVLNLISENVIDNDKNITLTASAGISIFEECDKNPEDIMKKADIALSYTKKNQKNNLNVFSFELYKDFTYKRDIVNDINNGLKNSEFKIWYQPIVDIRDKKTVLAEALVRWCKGEEIISPGVFIPVAEETGLIIPMTYYIFEKVCENLKQIIDNNEIIQVSVNIPVRMFEDNNLPKKLNNICKKYNINNKLIILELTESSAMDNSEITRDMMKSLSEYGFKFAIDDFGTGYSNLSYLNSFDFQKLKIDMEFIKKIGNTKKDDNLVQTIIFMANNLDMETVAEGVEEEFQYNCLKGWGCNQAQGYLFGKPMPFNDFFDHIKNS